MAGIVFIFASTVVALGERNTQCAACGRFFRRPRVPLGPVATVLLWCLLLMVVSVCVGAFVDTRAYLDISIPFEAKLATVTDYVSRHPAGVAAAGAVFFGVGLIVAPLLLITSIISHRNKIAKEYEVHLESGPLVERKGPAAQSRQVEDR